MPTLTGKKCINFFNEAYEYNKTKKYLYRLPRSESFLFPSRLPSALVAWETCLCRCDRCSSLRSSSRIVAVVPVLSSTVATMAALESHAAGLSTFPLRPTCFHATSCTSAMMELMPCALTPAYGVTSICRFVQAVTALSIVPTVYRSSPLLSLGLLAVLFGLLSISFCHPSRHLASAFSHVQPSSLFGPSPRVSTAGAYCWQSIVTPRLPWWFSGTHP